MNIDPQSNRSTAALVAFKNDSFRTPTVGHKFFFVTSLSSSLTSRYSDDPSIFRSLQPPGGTAQQSSGSYGWSHDSQRSGNRAAVSSRRCARGLASNPDRNQCENHFFTES